MVVELADCLGLDPPTLPEEDEENEDEVEQGISLWGGDAKGSVAAYRLARERFRVAS